MLDQAECGEQLLVNESAGIMEMSIRATQLTPPPPSPSPHAQPKPTLQLQPQQLPHFSNYRMISTDENYINFLWSAKNKTHRPRIGGQL